MNQQNPEKVSMPKWRFPTEARVFPTLVGRHGSSAFVLLYFVGFVAASAYSSQFLLARVDILDAQILAAGMLFIISVTFPVYGGVLLGEAIFRGQMSIHNPRFSRSERFQSFGAAIVVLAAWALALYLVGPLFLIGEPSPNWTFIGLYTASAGLAGVIGSSLEFQTEREVREHSASSSFMRILLQWIMLPVTLMIIFASAVYPQIRGYVGGGAGWLVEISTVSGALPPALEAALRDPVVMLDHSERGVTLLLCSESGSRLGGAPVQILSSSLTAIEYVGQSSALRPC